MAGRLACLLFCIATGAATADSPPAASPPSAALVAGESAVAVRYRYEFVDQDEFSKNANASTARLRLNYLSGAWSGWRAFGEFDYVGTILVDDYNSGGGTSPGKSDYPVVADPEGADLNQLYAEYERAGLRLRFGRQRILLDNQRFVGNVGWRQNEQTYDAIGLLARPFAGVELQYAWVANVNRIYGDSVPAGDERSNTHLLNLHYERGPALQLSAYTYYLDGEDTPSTSGLTAGVRATGRMTPGGATIDWVAEYAWQGDAADAPVDYEADYLHASLSWQINDRVSVGAGAESLGGDRSRAGAAFRTPLATLHAFQGWADQFLTTPDAGVIDSWLGAGVDIGRWEWQAKAHRFEAESGNTNFGSELDVAVSRRFGEHYELLLKAAAFESDNDAYPDTRKAWLMVTASY